jgi:pimeloyl-ACP methyl ester carboxylesterase
MAEKTMQPNHVQYLAVDNARVAWLRLGPVSPPVVFLHGLGDSSIMSMSAAARELALVGISSVLIDLPGFGYASTEVPHVASMEEYASIVTATFDALDLRDATIVGHSMGGSVALLAAHGSRQRIRSLILAEPLLVREHSTLARAIAKRDEGDFLDRGYAMLVRATRRQAARGDSAARGFLAPLMRADARVLHESAVSLLADRTPMFLDLLRTIEVPTALLLGERTSAVLPDLPKEVNIRVIPDAGHAMMHENQRAFVSAIGQWMKERRAMDVGARHDTNTGHW